jgi:hypothetical protein
MNPNVKHTFSQSHTIYLYGYEYLRLTGISNVSRIDVSHIVVVIAGGNKMFVEMSTNVVFVNILWQ